MSPRTHIARRGRRWLLGLAVATAALAAVGSATADTQTTPTVTVGPTATNFSTTVDVPQFNPADHGGNALTKVTCTVTANVSGKITVENRDAGPADITSTLSANVKLGGATSPISVTGAASKTFNDNSVPGTDGLQDFMGRDTIVHDVSSTVGTPVSVSITDPAGLLLFTGTGNIRLPVSATATSTASGPGNVGELFNTVAGAGIFCVYEHGGVVAVTLRSVTAKRSAKGVTVNWRTASEIDVAGYNVYGLVHGKRVKLNSHVIASKGAGANSYAFSYRTPKGQQTPSRLWLQAINLDGSRQWRTARVIR